MQQFLLYHFLALDSTVTFLWALKIIIFFKKERKKGKKEGRKKRNRTKKGTGANGTGKKIITKMQNEISSHYQSWKWQKTTSLCYFSWSLFQKTENVALCRAPQSHAAQTAIGIINVFERRGKLTSHEWGLRMCTPYIKSNFKISHLPLSIPHYT